MMNHTVDEYIAALPDDRGKAMTQLREIINQSLPEGFTEVMGYGMPSWVVPHSLYPAGYHCNPQLPLPFLSIANQKQHIGFYHMGIYADPDLLKWFQDAYAALNIGKLDIGKSCIRFKKPATIPYDLLKELLQKMTPENWIERYENAFKG